MHVVWMLVTWSHIYFWLPHKIMKTGDCHTVPLSAARKNSTVKLVMQLTKYSFFTKKWDALDSKGWSKRESWLGRIKCYGVLIPYNSCSGRLPPSFMAAIILVWWWIFYWCLLLYVRYSPSSVVLVLKLNIPITSPIASLHICSQSSVFVRWEHRYHSGVGCTVSVPP